MFPVEWAILAQASQRECQRNRFKFTNCAMSEKGLKYFKRMFFQSQQLIIFCFEKINFLKIQLHVFLILSLSSRKW